MSQPDLYCHRCGAPTDASARFCKKCGTRRIVEPDVSWPASPSPAAGPNQPPAGAGPYGANPPSSWPQAPTQTAAVGAFPGYAAQPPARSDTSIHRRAWVAAGAIGGALVVAAVVLILVLSSSPGGASVRAAAVVTVTRTSESAPTNSKASAAPRSAASSQANSVTPTQPLAPRLVPYDGARITAAIPAGWGIEEDEVQKPGYVESRWADSADSADYTLIDESPAKANLTLEQDASPVHQALQASSGYQQLFYGPGDLAGVQSWMWIFQISGDRRIDYFFNRCTGGFAVLGSTPINQFDQLRATFRAVAQSVQSTCHS